MRCLLLAATATLAGLAVAHSDKHPQPLRKSLGFGPKHPHAEFHASPYSIATNGFMPAHPDSDPFVVAKTFVEDVLVGQLDQSRSYKIRKDSYTDKNTGVTHVYVRQVINGVEVADGDMNVNIKDGMVLSYGNSFFKGDAPAPFGNPDAESIRLPHEEFCFSLNNEFESHIKSVLSQQNGQTVMDKDALSKAAQQSAGPLFHTLSTQCGSVASVPYMYEAQKEDLSDLRPALLQFMAIATPKEGVAQDIHNNYDSLLENMSVWSPSTFAPSDDDMTFFVNNVPDTVNPVKAKLAYIQVPNKDETATVLNLVWKFEVEMEDNWYESYVSATSPHHVISVVDWASDSNAPIPKPDPSAPEPATYNVFAWGINDPSEGNRSLVKENYDTLASPVGWHSIPYAHDPSLQGVRLMVSDFYRNTTTTWGNNIFAQENWEGQNSFISNYRPDAGKDSVYDYTYAPKETDKVDAQDEAKKHINATVTQLFYTGNMIHDMFYRYGFDEISGNFQAYNFERGGQENDAVITNAQDGSGYNNANFMTPPDGQNGRMRMYLWNTALPYRDGDFEAGIVIHEYAHGISTRLTGGPANSGCLGWGESGGMGEGWGDFFATTIRSTEKYSDFPMGAWAANRDGGIRNYPYSLNDTVNPSTYKTLDKPGYWGVHAIGEVWAQILWVVEQRLIAEHGYSSALYPPMALENGTVPEGDFYRPRVGKKPLVPKHGNTLAIQLVVNGMKLQPCRPSFFDARDAIIAADQILTGGENYCTLWNAFSERGLGADATIEGRTPWGGGIRTDGYQVPLKCQS